MVTFALFVPLLEKNSLELKYHFFQAIRWQKVCSLSIYGDGDTFSSEMDADFDVFVLSFFFLQEQKKILHESSIF